MRSGDLLLRVDWNGELDPKLVGVLLEVQVDKKLMKNPFSVPWVYKVAWNDGSITTQHGMGNLRPV